MPWVMPVDVFARNRWSTSKQLDSPPIRTHAVEPRMNTNGTDFVVPYPNQPPDGEFGAFSAILIHFPYIRVHSCQFVVSLCMTPDKGSLVASSSADSGIKQPARIY
jgi:hypothetical protein